MRLLPVLNAKVVQPNLLDPHGPGWRLLAQQVVVLLGAAELGVRPLVPNRSSSLQIRDIGELSGERMVNLIGFLPLPTEFPNHCGQK